MMHHNINKGVDNFIGCTSLAIIVAGVGCSIAHHVTFLQEKLMLAWLSSGLLLAGGAIMALWAVSRQSDSNKKSMTVIAGIIGVFSCIITALFVLALCAAEKGGGGGYSSCFCFGSMGGDCGALIIPALIGLVSGAVSGASAYYIFEYAMEEALLPSAQAKGLAALVIIGAAVLTFALSSAIFSISYTKESA